MKLIKAVLVVILTVMLWEVPIWAGGPEPIGLTKIEPGWAPGTAVNVLPEKAIKAAPAADAAFILAGENGETGQIATLEATGRQSHGVAIKLSINGYFPVVPTGSSFHHWQGVRWVYWTDLTRQPIAAKKPARRKILSGWIFW